MAEEPWQRSHGRGAMAEEPWQRSLGREAMAEEPWQRSHGRGAMAEEPWQRSHGRGALEASLQQHRLKASADSSCVSLPQRMLPLWIRCLSQKLTAG